MMPSQCGGSCVAMGSSRSWAKNTRRKSMLKNTRCMLCLLATGSVALAPSRLVDVAPLAPSRLFRHATPQPLRAEEEAFLAAISCDGDDEARAQRIYATYGVVRLLEATANADALVRQGTAAGVPADAFGQASRDDRFTILLRGTAEKWVGDGSDSVDDSRGDGILALQAPAVAALLDDDDAAWRRVCGDKRIVSLAEMVVSNPGGKPQNWHYDGVGATAQVALVDVTCVMGPTELVPRVMPAGYVSGRNRLARAVFDVETLLTRAAWALARPFAPWFVDRGLRPATVRLTAPKGSVVVYDSAMFHRGGENRGEAPRPILAIHVRDDPNT